MNHAESKKKLDEIRREYGCKGDIILRTAIQYVVEYGKNMLLDEGWYEHFMFDIDKRHDEAEAEGKILFCTREFEKALIDCAKALCEVNTYDLLMYIQREVWLGGDGISYQRAIELLRNCVSFFIEDTCELIYARDELTDDIGFREDELEELGFDILFDYEEEEEE